MATGRVTHQARSGVTRRRNEFFVCFIRVSEENIRIALVD